MINLESEENVYDILKSYIYRGNNYNSTFIKNDEDFINMIKKIPNVCNYLDNTRWNLLAESYGNKNVSQKIMDFLVDNSDLNNSPSGYHFLFHLYHVEYKKQIKNEYSKLYEVDNLTTKSKIKIINEGKKIADYLLKITIFYQRNGNFENFLEFIENYDKNIIKKFEYENLLKNVGEQIDIQLADKKLKKIKI